ILSPLIAALGGQGCMIEEADALPPLAARATLVPVLLSYASISTTRLRGPAALRMTSWILSVVTAGERGNLRHTLLFPVTLPPGTVTHCVPAQYCTSKSTMPYFVNVSPSVGSTGGAVPSNGASWVVKISISPMVFGPLKLTWI